MHKVLLGALTASVLAASTALGQDFTPALIFDMGGKFDKSFNEAAYNGAETVRHDTMARLSSRVRQALPGGVVDISVALVHL